MSDKSARSCLTLPCSAEEIWAVPKNCLAEIITLYGVDEQPPAQISWRGHDVAVLDMDDSRETRWRDQRAATGLVAILLGIDGLDCRYLGVALRGQGLGLHEIPDADMEDCPQLALPRSAGAFRWNNVTYQVPDLLAIQKNIALDRPLTEASEASEYQSA